MSTVKSTEPIAADQSVELTSRRRLLTTALIVGPLLVTVSALFNHTPASQEAADVLAAVRAHRGEHLAEVLLEMLGLAVSFAAAAAAALRVRTRGAALATVGAVGSVLGIIGFTMVNAEGMVVNALAGMADQAAAERAVAATNSSPAVFVAFPMILLGELGLVAVLAGFRRAGVLPVWPAVIAFGALVVDFAGGSRWMLIVSDLLMLAALGWLAAALRAQIPTKIR